jgi:hypothetical protein
MDPLSALSVAAAVVQFVDFGARLLSNTAENYHSSSVEIRSREDVEEISRDLATLNEEVQSKSHLAVGSSEKIFVRLCQRCADVAKELAECVEVVSSQSRSGRAFQSFFLALREGRSVDKIKSLRIRLEQIQQQMVTAAMVFMWYVSNTLSVTGTHERWLTVAT